MTSKPYGLIAEFDTPADAMHAAERVRDAGFTKWDVFTPFPVHGLDRSMGMKKTILPWIVLGGGLTGTALAIFMQWYVNSPHTQFAQQVRLHRLHGDHDKRAQSDREQHDPRLITGPIERVDGLTKREGRETLHAP